MSYNFTSPLDLNPVRLLTDSIPYHYSMENKPHEDHIANAQILIDAIQELRTAVNTQLAGPQGSQGVQGVPGKAGANGTPGESAPVLGLMLWPSGMTLPNTNWLVCSGQELLLTDYPLLTPLGDTFGTPSEAGKVKLPDNTGNTVPNTVLIMRVKNEVV